MYLNFPRYREALNDVKNYDADQIRACTRKNNMASKYEKIANFAERLLLYYNDLGRETSGTIYLRYYLPFKPNLLLEWSSPLNNFI